MSSIPLQGLTSESNAPDALVGVISGQPVLVPISDSNAGPLVGNPRISRAIRLSAALDFPSIAAAATATLTIAAPANVVLPANSPVVLGLPGNASAGLVFQAWVTTGGASVTVSATNVTAGPIDQAALPFTVDVQV